jgi:hypothetical protein
MERRGAVAEEYEREERRVRLALRLTAGLAIAALALALVVRFRPEALSGVAPRVEAVVSPAASDASTALILPAHRDSAPESSQLGAAMPAEVTPPDSAPVGRAPDVVLLPCNTPNPRPDGSFLIPPHNPRHVTIVGLPAPRSEPQVGLVVPPHDPSIQNRIPVRLVPLDSILTQTIRLPPHNPDSFTIARRDTVACLPPRRR